MNPSATSAASARFGARVVQEGNLEVRDPLVGASHHLDAETLLDASRIDPGDVVEVGPDHAVQLRAATTVLDRTGMGPTSTAELNVSASLHLAALIAELDGD